MGSSHVLAIPYAAQGHIIPLMELSHNLVMHGFKITFVNTDFSQERIVKSFAGKDDVRDQIRLVSIPDGLEAWEDRNDLGKSCEGILRVMPKKLEELIQEINGTDDHEIACVIADGHMGWALEVAEKMGIKRAAFWPSAAAMMVLTFRMQNLIDDGIVDDDGTPIKNQNFHLSPNMPTINTANLPWTSIGDSTAQTLVFKYLLRNNKSITVADWLICNSTYDLEPDAFSLAETLLPVGPLLASNRQANTAGHFWPEDSTCLEWLDQQPACSVIYVAFGSFTVLDKAQFRELALGLELCNRPFLWVVRPDITTGANDAYPEGFQERVSSRGLMVGWAPQQKVLSHPSVACFLSHCGWNSTMEGVSNGVPFLCWPYFGDQILNQGYICDVWRVGLGLHPDERGLILGEEIKNKVDQLLMDEKFKARAMELKEMTAHNVKEGGKSHNNLKNFIEWIKS
ncbi:hypothetical protein PVL29_018920 [Vitis rotundifolia]|uniref:UDP-glycosyltransferase 83A1 n=2 Tax=Vitis rotundifolia TaxID=103349 RepID=A0AA39DFM2_VITRO|nr:hypothetical protein PVL29_018920 [Vitis rotundifolia]